MVTFLILFTTSFFIITLFYLLKILNLLKMISRKLSLSNKSNSLTQNELEQSLEKFRLVQKLDIEKYRLAKKRDLICLLCNDKVCHSHKKEYFICDKYKELGL